MPAKKFVTKRVEIEAIRLVNTVESYVEVFEFCGGVINEKLGHFRFRPLSAPVQDMSPDPGMLMPGECVGIHYLVFDILHDTWIKVYPGQWIVRGAKGEYYPCDDETFMWKYEPTPEQRIKDLMEVHRQLTEEKLQMMEEEN